MGSRFLISRGDPKIFFLYPRAVVIALIIVLKIARIFVPTLVKVARITTEISPTISPYSMAVAPFS
jgi:hypothetical protein